METEKIPVVRLSLIAPVLSTINSDGYDPTELLAKFGWPSDASEAHELFVPAQSIYDFFEEAAVFTNDRYIGARTGQSADMENWPPLREAMKVSQSLGECLLRIIREVRHQATSIVYHLSSDGDLALLRATRTFEPKNTPYQTDAFRIAGLFEVLKAVVGKAWDPSAVTAVLTDPSVFPPEGLPAGCLVAGDSQDTAIRFPADWLLITRPGIEHVGPKLKIEASPNQMHVSIVTIVREVIERNLHDSSLKIETVAKHCGLSVHELRNSLSAAGTTFAEELRQMKIARANDLLAKTSEPIARIAAMVGFTTPANFTRAFKGWEGVLPKEYRKRMKKILDK